MFYEFDRYVDGKLMAEGVRIALARDLPEALAFARALCAHDARTGEMKRTTFVLARERETAR